MTTHNTSDDDSNDNSNDQSNSHDCHHHQRRSRERLREREERRAERSDRRRSRHARGDRKERVLHTRVSEQLSDDIRRLAEDLRVPASNLVRNVLEEVFTVVESVSDDVGDLFEEVLEETDAARDRIRRRAARYGRRRDGRRRRSHTSAEDVEDELRKDEAAEATVEEREQARTESPSFPEVVGWQPLVLNRDQSCADCGGPLRRGERAFLGLTEQGLSRTTLCGECVTSR